MSLVADPLPDASVADLLPDALVADLLPDALVDDPSPDALVVHRHPRLSVIHFVQFYSVILILISFFTDETVEVEVEFDSTEAKALRRYLLEGMMLKLCSPLCIDYLKATVPDSKEFRDLKSGNWAARRHTTFAIFDDEQVVSVFFFILLAIRDLLLFFLNSYWYRRGLLEQQHG